MEQATAFSRRALFGGAFWLSGLETAWAKKKKPSPIPSGRAKRVMSGQGFTLTDGRTVRLSGVKAPRIAYGDIHGEPLAREAKAVLSRLVMGRALSFEMQAPDKFSRLRAQVFAHDQATKTQIWIQGEMLRTGFARVQTWRDDHDRSTAMLALEAEARAAKKGLWAEPYYAVRTPHTLGAAMGSFQIIEGRIIDTALVRGRVYLNFGADWRKDFTISIAPKDTRSFKRAGIVLAGLAGVRVRARGLVRSQNGPILYLDHPAALEILPG
jgi:endonuclease YncB( thermonuclease family)